MDNSEQSQISSEDADLKKVIFQETVDFLYKAIPSSASATIIIALFLMAVLWQFFDKTLLIIWFIVLASINVARFVLYKFYSRREKNIEQTYLWDRLFYFLLILNGLCFSSVSIWFLPADDSVYHYFPEMILIGLAAGAVTSLSFSMRNIVTYFILLIFPLFITEIFIGTFIAYSVAGLTVLLTVFSLANAKRFNKTVVDNIILQYNSKKHNEQLIESKNTAIAANSAKNNFISLMSHELRTPLNAILGFSQLLKMSDSPVLNEEQDEHAQGIIDSGNHLLSLIEELLDLSKIEANKVKIKMEDISVANVISQSIAILHPVAHEYEIDIINNVENKYLVKADEKRLKQILINLISNAVKYNQHKGQVTINAELPSKNRIRVSVSDDGQGLTAEQQSNVFKPFQRFDTKQEGIGLGLYIVHHLVEMMEGKIGVESEFKRGSTFWFELNLIEEF